MTSPPRLCLLAALALAAPARPAGPAPASAPAAGPAATAPAEGETKLPADLDRRWAAYLAAWAGKDLRRQFDTDNLLVEGILRAAPADAAELRRRMIRQHESLANAAGPDPFRCGMLASRIALSWTRVDERKELTAAELAINRKAMCDGVTDWALRALDHLAGVADSKADRRLRAFAPGTAGSMLSLMRSRLPWATRLGEAHRKLLNLREAVEKLIAMDASSAARLKAQADDFYRSLEPLGRLAADKAAIRTLLMNFQKAWNTRDGKLFVSLWPSPDHPRVRSLKTQTLATRTPETHWKIIRWEPAYIIVKGDKASAFVVSQYQTKDGMNHPVTLQGFPAKRMKDGTWKLN